jgi:hypothetical protein
MKNKTVLSIICLFLFLSTSLGIVTQIFAEQGNLSPESGSTSRLKTISDSLTSLGFGSNASGSWGNWGNMWNRIYSASTWTPNTSNNAVAGDVALGKKFYAGNNRTEITGTAVITTDYSIFKNQSFCQKENTGAPCTAVQPAPSPATTWTNTATNVWKDNRTGLYWSNSIGQMPINFTISSCPFFSSNPRGSYGGADITNCGLAAYAINTCANLSKVAVTGESAKTDWYLPTRVELLQAYNNNMYGLAGSAFTTTSWYASSTESSVDSTRVWSVRLDNGSTGTYISKVSDSYQVRCVSRD